MKFNLSVLSQKKVEKHCMDINMYFVVKVKVYVNKNHNSSIVPIKFSRLT